MNQTNGAGNRDGTLEYAVVLRLLQKVHAKSVETLCIVLGWEFPKALFLYLFLSLMKGKEVI